MSPPTLNRQATPRKVRPTSEAASLQRGLAVLELLAQRPEGATLREIAAQLHLPGASTLRITRTLVSLGYLSREEGTKRFFLTSSFLLLGQPRGPARGISECALPAMRSIRQQTGETTQLCCLAGTEMVIIEQLLSVHPFKYSADLGARCPCYSCAPGKAILAFRDPDEQEVVLERIRFKRFTETTITSKRGLQQHLQEIRRAGYATDRAEGLPGVHCVAAPVLDRHGLAVAAITIAGPSTRVLESAFEKLGSIVQAGARHASDEFQRQ